MISTRLPLDGRWTFGGKYLEGMEEPSAALTTSQLVNLPHCVTQLSWCNWDPSSWEDVWFYRRTVVLPPSLESVRVLLEFEGSLTSTTPYWNGIELMKAEGGYLPFVYDVSSLARPGSNELAVVVDGTWQMVPPEGNPDGPHSIDFYQPSGLYRHVGLWLVPSPARLVDIWVDPSMIPSPPGCVTVTVRTETTMPINGHRLTATLTPSASSKPVGRGTAEVGPSAAGRVETVVAIPLEHELDRWSFDSPNLYDVSVALADATRAVVDRGSVRTGFRDAEFRPDGFYLNGRRMPLFGLNRHQLYPYTGMAMPDRAQAEDAKILKNILNCNMVRCSHYPQARAFLDACDELGLAVWQEPPGWGWPPSPSGPWDPTEVPAAWLALWFNNVTTMVLRDRSRPSVIIWGVQPNETQPPVGDANRAKERAKKADPSRPTSGSMSDYLWEHYMHDVCAYDDYPGAVEEPGSWRSVLKPPVAGRPYLVSESIGALSAYRYYRRIDHQPQQHAQAALHAAAHSAARDPAAGYAGLLGWCAFDYPSHNGNFWPEKALKTPGVLDVFRVPKPGAALYQSQAPQSRPVIQPAFFWDFDSRPVTELGSSALVYSNCDRIEAFLDGRHVATLPRRSDAFPHLAFPPFELDTSLVPSGTKPVLRLEGYIGNTLRLSCSYDGDRTRDRLLVEADNGTIEADGSDATRVTLLAVDSFSMPCLHTQGQVTVSLSGPGGLIGDKFINFADTGGCGAVWVRGSRGRPGKLVVVARHAHLGQAQTTITSTSGPRARVASVPRLPPVFSPPFPLGGDYIGVGHNGDVPAVRSWQQQMRNLGWTIAVDGNYGPASRAACVAFQSAMGLEPDGEIGPQTWGATFE